jgi:hypothetical protein
MTDSNVKFNVGLNDLRLLLPCIGKMYGVKYCLVCNSTMTVFNFMCKTVPQTINHGGLLSLVRLNMHTKQSFKTTLHSMPYLYETFY